MADVHDYSLGTPCWFELGTTDQSAAKQFYGELFGWSAQDYPMGPDDFYTMLRLNGRDAGAVYTLPAKLVEQGVVAHWNVYFAAPDVDASAARISELGDALIQPPFDVMDAGRMAICKDPGGAMFSLWQGKRHRGAAVLNENNAVCWSELATWDTGQARDFYTGMFGWETRAAQTWHPTSSSARAGRREADCCRWTSSGRESRRIGASMSWWRTAMRRPRRCGNSAARCGTDRSAHRASGVSPCWPIRKARDSPSSRWNRLSSPQAV